MEIMPEMTEMDEEEMFDVLFKGTVRTHSLTGCYPCHLYESTHERYYGKNTMQRHQKETNTYQEHCSQLQLVVVVKLKWEKENWQLENIKINKFKAMHYVFKKTQITF